MIYLFSGTPGSGKSLHIAQIIYYTLKLGKKDVICNFDIDLNCIKNAKVNKFHYIPNDKMNPNILISISKQVFNNKKSSEGKILLIIDECQLLFNAREWNSKGRAEWLSFFSQHRKYGFDICLVAQFDGMVDRQIRSLIEYNIIHRKVSNFGIKGKIFSLFGFGKLFVYVKVWYPLNERISSRFFRASKKYYQIYDTYNTFD